MGRLSCQSMALKVEGGPPAQWGLNPGPLGSLHLYASCLENSSSPLASWREGLVLLLKPLTSQSGQKAEGVGKPQAFGSAGMQGRKMEVRNRGLVADLGTHKVPYLKV